jgi:hypothetical protein
MLPRSKVVDVLVPDHLDRSGPCSFMQGNNIKSIDTDYTTVAPVSFVPSTSFCGAANPS